MRTAILVLLWAARLAGQPGSVDGTVVDRTNSKPIAGVHVRLYIGAMPQMAKAVYGAMSDADGHYSVAGMQPGTYTVELMRTGFVSAPASGPLYNTEIVVHRGEHVAGRQLAMLPLVPMTGRVVNRYGDPVANTTVHASLEGSNPDRAIGPFTQAQTDELGGFRLFVTPGKYYVISEPWYGAVSFGTSEIRTDGAPDLPYATTYYPSAVDAESATLVEAKAGGEVTGIEIHPRTAAPRSNLTLSGTVTGIPEGGTATVSYFWNESQGSVAGNGGSTSVEPDGRFSLDYPGPGYVRLLAQCCSAASELQSEVAEIHVQQSDASEVQLTLAPGGVLTGKVEFAGGDAAAVEGKLKVELSAGQPSFNMMPVSGGIERDGTFRIVGVTPDAFTVSIEGLPDDGYFQKILLNGNATEGTLDFSHGVRDSRLTIAIGLDGGEISGELRDADGGPTLSPRPHVYLVPEPGSSGPIRPDATVEGTRYVLKGIPPGKYKLFVADYILVTPDTRPAFLAAAETVEVAAGARVVHDLKMLEAPDANAKK
jgi:hypothetical protein